MFEEFQPDWEEHGDKSHGQWSNEKHGKFTKYEFH